MATPTKAPQATSVTLNGQTYGAQPDERGPIGGGAGYHDIRDDGDFVVSTVDELLEALEKAAPGQVIFIPGRVRIDCTERVYIDKLKFTVPAGVTLASDRGRGNSNGGMVFSDAYDTRPLFEVVGDEVRFTGLRVRGPNPKRCLEHHRRCFSEGRGHEYYYKFPVSDGILTNANRLRVDNCELSACSHAAISLRGGQGHHVHHNYIHHNQYNGLGYGVSHDIATSLIEQNLFNFNRHSIAGTGRPDSGYEARHNVELGTSLSHCFDMHGGRDRKDGTNVAGKAVSIHHNLFRPNKPAVVIRGEPESGVQVHHNWFRQAAPEKAVRGETGTTVTDNACGLEHPTVR